MKQDFQLFDRRLKLVISISKEFGVIINLLDSTIESFDLPQEY